MVFTEAGLPPGLPIDAQDIGGITTAGTRRTAHIHQGVKQVKTDRVYHYPAIYMLLMKLENYLYLNRLQITGDCIIYLI